ncbi:M23 family metallopeptidase [Chryseomicrobium sp. FSL W7-1435]|uniref:M23 family metallopeptidase n=1 Tax=Chryseomicrobium sp. FSL W7-1435 TaxID=2921704 RepID=UPI00315B0C2D
MFWNKSKEETPVLATEGLSRKKTNVVKKAAITVILLSGLSVNLAFADETADSELTTIYHIYTEDQYIGALSDKNEINELMEEKIEASKSQFKDLSLTAGNNFSVVEEKVFTPATDNATTLQQVEDLIEVNANAFAISIDNEVAAYVKDLDAYNEVLQKVKLNYVSEKELNFLEARKTTTDTLPELKPGETRIVDLLVKQDVFGATMTVKPEEVVAVDDAVERLLTGVEKQETYTVQQGDVISSIASAHNLSTKQLLALNEGLQEGGTLKIGQELKVTVLEPALHFEAQYEKKAKEKIAFDKIVEETDTLYKGDTKMKTEGANGERLATYVITKENGVQTSKEMIEEEITKQVQHEVTLKGTKVMPSRGSGSFAWPAQGGYISSHMGHRWGRMHQGIDIARPSGYAILASDNGVVVAAGVEGGLGNRVIIDHNNGYRTVYGHLASINVSVGQTVPQGTNIGVMGNTGRSTGTHLHFEVIQNGTHINPMSVLK